MAANLEIAEPVLDSAGQQLRRAREAAGKTLADISAATKIPERLLIAIEESRYAALPSRIYAVGFSRSYARLVGLDEAVIVNEVRAEMDGVAAGSDIAMAPAFAPGDPARVPDLRLAVIAGLIALAVVVTGLLFWHSAGNPAGSLPSILPAAAPPAAVGSTAARAPAMPTVPRPTGVVTINALEAGIWIKIYEASGKVLFVGPLALGQSFTVPADARAPLIWTARPDALAIAIDGKPVAKLSETQKKIKGVPISAAALLARSGTVAGAIAPVAPGSASAAQ